MKAEGGRKQALKGFQRTGVIAASELKKLGQVPSLARLRKGPAVVVECVEEIPCNPCAGACPRKAITVEPSLVSLPKVDYDKCNGCTICIARCPGLAIFVVDYNLSETEAAVTIPCEMLPRPAKGAKVTAVDRAGEKVCAARVVKVLDAKALDRCALVTLAVPKKHWNDVRGFKKKSEGRSQKTELRSRKAGGGARRGK